MNNINKSLTELDIKHIANLIGRDPNEYELRLIEHILSYELKHRIYLEIIGRLNKGANRKISERIQLDRNSYLYFYNGIKIFNNDKLVYDQDDINTRLNSDEIIPLSNNYSIISDNYDEITFRKKMELFSENIAIQFWSLPKLSEKFLFQSLIGKTATASKSITRNFSDYKLFRIIIGKGTKKNQKSLINLINSINNRQLSISTRISKNQSIAKDIIRFIVSHNFGINVLNKYQFEDLVKDKNELSVLLICDKKDKTKLNSLCQKENFELVHIGDLIEDQVILLNNKNEVIFNLPISVFDLQYDINPKHYQEPEAQTYKSKDVIKGVNKTSLSNQLTKLLKKIIADNSFDVNDQKMSDAYCQRVDLNNGNKLAISPADHNNLFQIVPRTSAKIVVANAARKLACTGVKPNLIQIHNLFPDANTDSNWQASEILQGQEEAIRELELTIANRRVDTYLNNWQQNVWALGFFNQVEIPHINFKNDGDFISLLGSHRGELGGSEYQRYISDKTANAFPTVDLNMERRLQDVVQQGIKTNLLKSATNVSLGGVSIAIAMSLITSKSGIGAKIHLSRKLSDEELLFGETQGLVIVTLAEEDIMEFERICMTVGVPSTTIGRVTENNIYTFNDSINIKVDNLRKAIV